VKILGTDQARGIIDESCKSQRTWEKEAKCYDYVDKNMGSAGYLPGGVRAAGEEASVVSFTGKGFTENLRPEDLCEEDEILAGKCEGAIRADTVGIETGKVFLVEGDFEMELMIPDAINYDLNLNIQFVHSIR
jgi:hypothetical protein